MAQATQAAAVVPPDREFKSFYTPGVHADKCMYPDRLDTYGCGCWHNCSYCYARFLNELRGNWHPYNPKVADIGKIEKTINKLPPGSVVRMGGMTDCFQPIERIMRVTLETIKLLNRYRIGYLIVTKSPLVSYPPYLNAMDPDLAHIQVSVTSLSHKLSKRYEVAPPPEQRVQAILTLQRHGFDVAIRLSPLIEEYMDFYQLNGLGIDKCIVEFLRINTRMSFDFCGVNFDKYSLWSRNYRHLPLEEKLRIIDKVKLPNISVCEKVSEHYDYWKNNYNPNPADCCNLRICS